MAAEVAQRLLARPRVAGIKLRGLQGGGAALLDDWLGRDAVVLVDTMRSGIRPGTIRAPGREPRLATERRHGRTSTDAATLPGRSTSAAASYRRPSAAWTITRLGKPPGPERPVADELEAIVPALVERVLREQR